MSNKIIQLGCVSMLLSAIVFAADFSRTSNQELLNMSGKVAPKDIISYKQEIEKRTDEMTLKEARDFREKLKEKAKEVYDNMKVKDFKARHKAIAEVFKEHCKLHKDPMICGPRSGFPDPKGDKRKDKKELGHMPPPLAPDAPHMQRPPRYEGF